MALVLRLALTGGSVVVTLLVVELVLRVFYSPPPLVMNAQRLTSSEFYEKDPELRWIPRKNVQGSHNVTGIFSSTFHTNSRGLRDKEYPLKKPAGRKRIVVIGDSFAWGWGANYDEIFTERLEAVLPDTDVINLGVTAYGLKQEIQYLRREGLQYEPDIVIVSFCLNDIYRPASKTRATSVEAAERSFAGDVKQFLISESVLYRFAIDRINTNKPLVKALVRLRLKGPLAGFEDLDPNLMPALRAYPPSLAESWEEAKSEFLQLKQLAQDSRIRLIVAVIPSVQSIQANTFEHTIAYSVFAAQDFDLDKPYRMLDDFALASGIELVNPVDRFRAAHNQGRLLYFKNEMHFNAAGHELFARALAEYLRYS